MITLRRVLPILTVSLCMPVASVFAQTTQEARQFVDTLGHRALAVVNSTGDETGKQNQLRHMFAENVDIPWMGQFVIGRAWQQASPDQRQQYLNAYQQYLLAHYTSDFADYSGSKYRITDVRDDGDGRFTVSMQIDAPHQKQETLAGYHLHVVDGKLKIYDIIIEGVSLITTERSEFTSITQREGMEKLISDLQRKAQTEEKS